LFEDGEACKPNAKSCEATDEDARNIEVRSQNASVAEPTFAVTDSLLLEANGGIGFKLKLHDIFVSSVL
jgi:hypothetical protein